MTEAEIKTHHQHKRKVAEWLKRNVEKRMSKYPQVFDSDERLATYIRNCTRAPEAHNLYELLGVKRFMKLIARYEWKPKRFTNFVRFYESLRFSGMTGRQHYRLTPVQVFQYANIFGLADNKGRRLCRIAYIFVPRKFSKTTSTAAIAVYDMLFGDRNAQAYVAANSYEQAKICFDEIRSIMHDFDRSGRIFRINREKISYKDGLHDSFIRCLSSNARTQDGLFASLVILDEYSQARDTAGKSGAGLRNVLTSSMGPRQQPLTMIITTASDVLDGPFVRELEGVKAVLREEEQNDTIFASLFLPDAGDDEGDPRTWAKVQPHLGITVQPDFYEKEYANARLSADNMMAFRTKLLNIFAINEQSAWLSGDIAKDISKPIEISSMVGRPAAMVGIDLSESDDFSAVSVGIYSQSNRNFFFHTAYFFPEGALEGHPNEKLYRLWAEQKHLKLTKGNVIDYREIVEYILELNKYVQILSIGYDQWKSRECINMLAAAGAKNVLVAVKQTYGNFTAPVESFEHGVKTGHIFINENPINNFCFNNAVLDEDNLENKKPIKRSHREKIDGLITMLMAMRLFIDYER